MTGMLTKEEALALVLQAAQETSYPIDSCREYSNAWDFARTTAPISNEYTPFVADPNDPSKIDPNVPIVVNKTTGAWEYCIKGFYPTEELPSHAYTIDAAGTFTEVPLPEYPDWDLDEDLDEDEE